MLSKYYYILVKYKSIYVIVLYYKIFREKTKENDKLIKKRQFDLPKKCANISFNFKKKKKEPFIYLALTKYTYRVAIQKKKIIAIDPLGGITISTNKHKSIPQIGQREPSNHRHVSHPIVWKIDFPRLTHTHTHTTVSGLCSLWSSWAVLANRWTAK